MILKKKLYSSLFVFFTFCFDLNNNLISMKVYFNVCIATDPDPTATDLSPDGRRAHWTAVPGHRQRGQQGVQQRRLSLLLYALPHVHRSHANSPHV